MKEYFQMSKRLKLGLIVRSVQRFARQEAGSTIVEAAFVLIFLIGITLGMADFATIIYTRNAVQSAAQEGAREAIMVEEDGSLRYSDIEQAVKDKLILLDPGKADITINQVSTDRVEVAVEYPVSFVTPIAGLFYFTSSDGWTVKGVATMVIR